MSNLLNQPMGTRPAGKMWLRWLALAVVVGCLATAFINLGFWQLDRLDQRRHLNQSVVQHEDAPVRDYSEVFGPVITDDDQWQRVRVTGTFDPVHQFVVRYRSNAGLQGYEVVTPLTTADGRHLLVDRGFAQRPDGQDFPSSAPPPPAGQVSIVGYVRRNDEGPQSALTPADGTIRLVNSTALEQALGYPLLNGYLTVLEQTPAAGDGLSPVQPPELTEGNHFSYAIQWFMFSGIAAVGLVLLIRSDVKARRAMTQEEAS